MIKGIVLVAAVVTLAVLAVSSYAMMGCSTGGHSAHAKEAAIVNTACPVTGEPADENVTYEYKGKVYGFCCPACIEEFKKSPEKYINKMESKSRGTEGMHEGHTH